jgi:hypothetical protein
MPAVRFGKPNDRMFSGHGAVVLFSHP